MRRINTEILEKYGDYIDHYKSKSLSKKVKGEVFQEEAVALAMQLEQFESYQKFNEETSQGDLGVLPSIALDTISATYSTSVIPILASVQPIDEVQGLVYYKNIEAQTTRGNVNANDTLVGAINGRQKIESGYASEEIYNEDTGQAGDGSATQFSFAAKYTPVRLRSVTITIENEPKVKGIDDGEGNVFGLGVKSGTIDYENGSVNIEFSEAPADGDKIFISYATDFEMINELPTVNTTFESKVIKARTFALRGVNSLFKNYQMEKRFGIDASEMIARDLVQELNTETSNAVIADAYINSQGTTEWDKTSPDGKVA